MTLSAVLLSVLLGILTFRMRRMKPEKARRISLILGLGGLCSLLAAAAVFLSFFLKEGEDRSAAAGPLLWYGCIVGPVFAVVALSLLVSSLLRRHPGGRSSDPKRERYRSAVRILLSALGSAACLLLSALWISMTRGTDPDLTAVYALGGIGLSLLMPKRLN